MPEDVFKKQKQVYITINTDSSFNIGWKVGAWAFWINCNSFRIKLSGYFNQPILSPEEAEIKCIGNALYALRKTLRERPVPFDVIHVNTSNKSAIAALDKKHGRAAKESYAPPVHLMMEQMKRDFHCTFNFAFVKAHSRGDSSREYVNKWCSREAKAKSIEIIGIKMEESKKTNTLAK